MGPSNDAIHCLHYIVNGLRGKGLVWFQMKWIMVIRSNSRQSWEVMRRLGKSWRRATVRLIRFYGWVFPSMARLFFHEAAKKRRLLVIYDLSIQPFTIGDMLLLQEGALVLRETCRLDTVDIAVVYNPKHPGSRDPAFADITKDNVMHGLSSILAVVQVNKYVGSVLVFDSHDNLHRFIADNGDFYHVWPSAWHSRTTNLFYELYNGLILKYYNDHGTVPYLSCPSFLVNWADNFFREHVLPMVPVTVQCRNKTYHPQRNLHVDCWLDFFGYCEKRYPVKFVIICAPCEIDNRMRNCSNVIIAKDYHTGIAQDLALTQRAAVCMGTAAGPTMMAVYSRNPYFFSAPIDLPYGVHGVIAEGNNIFRLPFATPLQRWTRDQETTELLIAEFERIWSAVDTRAGTEPSHTGNKCRKECQTYLR